MHILITANSCWNVWNFRRHLVDKFLSEGHKLTVLAPLDNYSERLVRIGCQVKPLTMHPSMLSPLSSIKLIGKLWYSFRKISPDIILSFTIKNNLFGAIAAKAANLPIVPNVTGLGTAFLAGGFLRWLSERLYEYCFRDLKVVFFQNMEDADLFISKGLVKARQARLLPGSGIDLERYSVPEMVSEARGNIFLMISRLLRDKGVVEYVDAARLVKTSNPDSVFRLLGKLDTENRTSITETTLEKWINEGVIEYLGETDDVRPFIASATCIVLPSYREGAPRTLMEASAMGRPVIATAVSGCTAVVEEGVSGLLCAPQSVMSLTNSLLDFIAMTEQDRQAMGSAGRAKMEREYDQAFVVSSYERAISDITGQ